jgi:hypothetical protein
MYIMTSTVKACGFDKLDVSNYNLRTKLVERLYVLHDNEVKYYHLC